jgi:hypothetical protein
MKNLLLTAVVISASFFTNQSEAQVRVNVNLNIGRPTWGLPGNQVGDWYYLPEIDTYYDIPRRQFVYFDRGQWIYANQLPYMYRDYNLARGHKVMINDARPFARADVYRRKYQKYYNTYRVPVTARRDNDRWDNDRNDRFDRDRNNQRFDNKRVEDRNDRRDNDRRDNDRKGRG